MKLGVECEGLYTIYSESTPVILIVMVVSVVSSEYIFGDAGCGISWSECGWER